MKVHRILFFLFCYLVISCTKFEDASPTSRNSLIHFYGTNVSQDGVKAIVDADGGFVIIGNIVRNDFVTDIVVIKTDAFGNTVRQGTFANGSASDIMPTSDGYLIIGDGIDYQPNADRISEIVNTTATLLHVTLDNATGFTFNAVLTKDSSVNTGTPAVPVLSKVDFHGSSFTFDAAGELVILGSYKSPETGALQKSFLAGLDPVTFAVKWNQTQEFLQKRDYVNSRALHLSTNQNLVWATTSETTSGSVTDAYLSIVYTGVGNTSTFKNNSKYGENAGDHYFTAADIQRSGIGFGVVGTYARTDNSSSNIYFVRVDDNGFIQGTAKFFDGINAVTDSTASNTDDTGNAITGTQDGGYVIAGSVQSTPSSGFGGADVVLIKVDAFGTFIWSKIVGGSGDDIPSSITETPDGRLLVCGKNKVNGLSSIFIMRTDKDGALTN